MDTQNDSKSDLPKSQTPVKLTPKQRYILNEIVRYQDEGYIGYYALNRGERQIARNLRNKGLVYITSGKYGKTALCLTSTGRAALAPQPEPSETWETSEFIDASHLKPGDKILYSERTGQWREIVSVHRDAARTMRIYVTGRRTPFVFAPDEPIETITAKAEPPVSQTLTAVERDLLDIINGAPLDMMIVDNYFAAESFRIFDNLAKRGFVELMSTGYYALTGAGRRALESREAK